MIQLSSAGKRYGHKLLFEGADWLITPRERVGLVGANGTGKSTLMKILAGLETLDYGSLSTAKGISAGYLPQDGLSLSGRTVFDECMTVFSALQGLEKEMEELTRRMSELDHASAEYAQVADRFHRIEHEFQTHDGYAIEAQVGTVSVGTGIQQRRHGCAAPKSSPAAGKCVSRLPSYCCKSPICCCSTNRRITSISKRATGWKNISRTIPTPSC